MKNVHTLLDEYRDDMLRDLAELVAIPSVAVVTPGDHPFGDDVQRAFEWMLARAEREGFDTFNADNYGGHVEFGGWEYDEDGDRAGRSDEVVGMVGHLDVVPVEPKDWKTDPFAMVREDGKLIGRGTGDDKGPTVACFYAMKALNDAGYRPKKRVRMILGLDEETNWTGMEKYLEKVPAPDMTFVPDSGFPLIYAEKGFVTFTLAAKFGSGRAVGTELRSLKGGSVVNAVPAEAKALIRASSYERIRDKLDAFRAETGSTMKSQLRGKSLEITAIGKAAHAAIPQAGLNAISVLMQFLGRIEDWNNEDVRDFITFYNTHIAMETDGRSMNLGVSDDIVGPLTFNVGLLKGDGKAASISVNCRCPVMFTDEDLYAAILPVCEKWDLGVVKESYKKALYVPKESAFIQTLMDCYRAFTGDTEHEPMTMGGATYARTLPNAVAFGARFPGDPSLAHQANEYTLEESLMRAAHIYAEAIVRLAECEDPTAEQTVRLASLADTERLGRLIAKNAKPGMVVALSGDLGAGKTTLTQAIAKGLGVKEDVTSPTFTLIREYTDGRMPLYHFDVYRLSSAEELEDIGCEEYFYGKGLSVVEWADRAGSLIPDDAVRISLAYGEKENERVATVTGMPVTGFASKKRRK